MDAKVLESDTITMEFGGKEDRSNRMEKGKATLFVQGE